MAWVQRMSTQADRLLNNPNFANIEENHEPINDKEDIKSNIEMPPPRDIRDTQPTISVNYRVVRNIEEKNLKNDQNYSNSSEKKDEWGDEDNEW